MLKYLTVGVKRSREDVTATQSSPRETPPEKLGESQSQPILVSIDSEKCLDDVLSLGIPPLHSSVPFLLGECKKPYWSPLLEFVRASRKKGAVYPSPGKELAALSLFPDGLEKVNVVILGQDPYHGPNQAHGLAFSVPHGVPLPPSLHNIVKEVRSDLGATVPASSGSLPHGNLEGWAKSGVLLLNAVLTVSSGQANSHAGKGWEKLTDAIVAHVSRVSSGGVVFMLWGKPAQLKRRLVAQNPKHLILEAPHPSPLSAHRGFLGCKHFSKANAHLVSLGRDPIDFLGLLGK